MNPNHKDMETIFSGAQPKIASMGLMIFDPVWGLQDHTNETAELIHVIKGEITLITGEEKYRAGPGDTLITPPNTVHRDEFNPEEGLEVFIIFFNWAAQEDFFSIVDNNALLKMGAGLKHDIGRIFNQLRTDRSSEAETDQLVAQARISTILMLMLRESIERKINGRKPADNHDRNRRRRALIQQAKEYLEKHLHKCVSLDSIAHALRVSPYYLSHVFSEENNFSLFAYLTALRMEKAKALLVEGKSNVSEAAYAVGFAGANYFSKVFRKHYGHPPRDYVGGPPGEKND